MRFSHVKICLASASPRRAELLAQIGIQFEICPADINESVGIDEEAEVYARRMADEKAKQVSLQLIKTGGDVLPVLAADTVVVLGTEIMGKPIDRSHGVEMLKKLSGHTHEVLTAVTLLYNETQSSRLSRSKVTFARLSDEDIEQYWESGEPTDKAGAYAIQGVAAVFIESLQGSYSGVMGLPVYEVGQMLDELKL